MCIGGGGSAEALPRPLAEEIKLNNLNMKKSSIGGNKYGDVSCPSNEFIYIYLSFVLFMCFLPCLEQKRILHGYGNADMALYEFT
jgi:hypothetical protein